MRDSPDYEGVGLPSHNIEKGDVEDCSILLLAVSWALRLYNRSLAKLAPELPNLLFSYRAFWSCVPPAFNRTPVSFSDGPLSSTSFTIVSVYIG